MSNMVYQSPESPIIVEDQIQTSVVGKWLALVGSLLLLGLPIGLISTILSMIETFQTITLFGTGDPKVMAGGISEAACKLYLRFGSSVTWSHIID